MSSRFQLQPGLGSAAVVPGTAYPRTDTCSAAGCGAEIWKTAPNQYCPACRKLKLAAARRRSDARRLQKRKAQPK